MSDWRKEAERAREDLEKRSFVVEVVEVDRDLPENSSLRVVRKLDGHGGKSRYRVVPEESEGYWY